MKEIVCELLSLADEGYKSFHSRLLPTVPEASIIGVRVPALRALARRLAKDDEMLSRFYAELPHACFEENRLHAELVSSEKTFARALSLTKDFLPYVDNWAVADALVPRAFAKNLPALLPEANAWLESPRCYVARVGVNMHRAYFLDNEFSERFFEDVLRADRDEYYVSMAVAWYFCDALIKRYDLALNFLASHEMRPATRRMLLTKVADTFRLSAERKSKVKQILSLKHDT